MMTGPLIMAALWSLRPSLAFHQRCPSTFWTRRLTRTFASFSTADLAVESGVSRLSTLQKLLSKHGAPGSQGCTNENDLVPVTIAADDDKNTPELVSSLGRDNDKNDALANLHPYLFPIAKSKSTGNYICAYRSPYKHPEEDSSSPWPIVETQVGAPGMQLLALNSEHLMRRIVCQCDFTETSQDSIDLYNAGLGQGQLNDPSLDAVYQEGSVAQLGYGVDKFVLLRVGPFPDLYQTMALQHSERGDEQSSLIAAEAANGKLAGFGSNFLFYAKLLATFDNREEESRDAARMCLRLPLPTIGMTLDDFQQVAVLGEMASPDDSTEVALQKMRDFYDKMREVEKEEEGSQGMTPEQMAIDEADDILNMAALTGAEWGSTRSELATKFRSVDRDDMATFVEYLS